MGAKILVVDDSAMVREQVGHPLCGAGFAVVEGADCVEALEKVAASPDTRLIVCDIAMPRMNGIQFLERMSTNGARVPVLILTTEGQVELMSRAKSLGAVGWIVKPFKPDL